MQVANRQILRNFLVRPLLKDVLPHRFRIGDRVRGKILQRLPGENMYILHTRGMNLIASTRLSLYVGDRIVGRVLRNQDQIELKLSEVNGKPVHQHLHIPEDGLAYARIPLPENVWGKETFLEIYPDRGSKRNSTDSEHSDHYHLILSSEALQNIILDIHLQHSRLSVNARIENPELYRFIYGKRGEIREVLRDERIDQVDFQVMLLSVEVSHFRKQWTDEVNLDIQA